MQLDVNIVGVYKCIPDFYTVFILHIFNPQSTLGEWWQLLASLKGLFLNAQTPREPAEDRGLLPESDAPDKGSLCGLLLQPPVCCQRPHTAQVWMEIYASKVIFF